MWSKIPDNILRDIHVLNQYTAGAQKESTLTICNRNNSEGNKVFTANAAGGNDSSIEVMDCDTRFGPETRKIGDVHTHPYHPEAVGLLPSHADLAVTLSESRINKNKQIACISNSQSPLITCQQPKRIPDNKKVNDYINHEIDSGQYYESEFHRKNVPKDFNFAYFDPKTGERVKKPSDESVLETMFGAATPVLREDISTKERDKLCRYVKSVSGQKSITKKCKQLLKK